jgi:hypothetical protein
MNGNAGRTIAEILKGKKGEHPTGTVAAWLPKLG